MTGRTTSRGGRALASFFPEQRLFLKSTDDTRFMRLSPAMQAGVCFGGALVLAWSIFATACLVIERIGAGPVDRAELAGQALYESRLNALAGERDDAARTARTAQANFTAAMDEIAHLQTTLLGAKERLRELESGMKVVQDRLRQTRAERDVARAEVTGLRTGGAEDAASGDLGQTVDMMAEALSLTARQRDQIASEAARAEARIARAELDRELAAERTDAILTTLEDAVETSLKPLDEMFKAAGLSPDRLLDEVRDGYSGLGGPLEEVISTKGRRDAATMRASEILKTLDEMNLYRLAADQAPFAMPLTAPHRFTSGFGPRWGRMHRGADFAAPTGTPILATAEGTVVHAGWQGGYGRLVTIRHKFGIETRYAHLSKIRVAVGQKVSRGDRIGDMGTSGRSTGTHLHYEVRVDGEAIDPMTYIKAAKDVF